MGVGIVPAVQPVKVVGPATRIMDSSVTHPDAKRSPFLVSIPRTQRWRASATASRGERFVRVIGDAMV
jgi:hypothetical protein